MNNLEKLSNTTPQMLLIITIKDYACITKAKPTKQSKLLINRLKLMKMNRKLGIT